jgi:flagellar biosynthesis/type III secretory pathway protein FliH
MSSKTIDHDQSFKNLILDYPRQALAFFAEDEAHQIDETTRVVPIRQEQLQERLGEKQLKYIDFIDIYAALDDNELAEYQRHYSQEAEIMETFASRFEQRGIRKGFGKGIQQGIQQGRR